MKLRNPVIVVSLAAALSLTACGNNEYGQGDQRDGTNNVRPIGYNQTSNQPMTDRNNNRMNNIDRDTRLDDNNQYMFERGMNDNDATRDMANTEGNNAALRGNNQGNNNNTTQGNTENGEYEIADKAQEQIKKDIPEINNVYVLTTENNAYVAASWDKNKNTETNENELSDAVRQRIVQSVKSVNNKIDNVYVSTNPDFLDLVNRYSEDVESGEPVEGMFNRMGNMIERVFPNNES
ncbi:YhcN/YlaJ family sporulation lipoprotein [Gracilibacillus oryzae]|uniref:YhcN/YlaJ family sporulation lipoprotein n=1 Tax=Gracilibacillus oryzae TaxID=1672701 RepID=A0A7C8L9G6_9BACI|nr:YhcN/YlaJ family sporulation lipoprotein [Gracilibacillus oryzae]KAB8138982.1 YhcN/YlaJ family sporulation lipoprotein [Gracilibacillus oryzae]